jgi:hypothetical protein
MKGIGFILLFVSCMHSNAQVFTLGPTFGINFASINFSTSFINSDTNYQIATQDAKFGLNGGMFMRIKPKNIFIQPAVLFSQERTSFKLLSNFDTLGEQKEIQYVKLDIPVNIGIKLGKTFRIQGGMVGSYLLSTFIKNSKANSKYNPELLVTNARWAYQLGIGFDIKKRITFDLKYEGNFSPHDMTINFNNTTRKFNSHINNIQFNLGFALIPFKKTVK